MATAMRYEIHSITRLFPEMSGEEFQRLVDDIAKHGQHMPIWTHEGAIIDGRHRYRACETLGIEPKVQEWDGEGSLTSFVVGLNLHRRHLDTSQRAAVAAEALPFFEGEAEARRKAGQDKGRQARWSPANLPETIDDADAASGDGHEAREAAAEAFNVSPRLVQDAKKVKQEAPEVFEKVKSGEMTVSRARQQIAPPKPRPEPSLADERPKMLSHGTIVNGQAVDDPPDVAKARKAGLIPADAKVEIDEPDEINVEAVKEQTIEALGKEADLSDAEWLAKLPLHGRLQGVPLRCFELSALTYRYVDAERQAFHAKLKRTMKALRKNAPGVIEGEWESRVSYALRLKHPSDWLQCPPVDGGGCGGTGQVQLIGQCANCKGRGFLIR
jgi:ParB-like chromosome segregation protein Spo0J